MNKRSPTDDWDYRKYNENGFRDTYTSGQRDIIILGDSFTEGSEGDNETYPFLLDRWTPNTSFHNFGMAGYGTAQELLVYRNVSTRYDHDIVILTYYLGNDARDNVDRRARRPVFELENGSLTQTHFPERRPTSSSNTQNPPGFLERYTKSYDFIIRRLNSLNIPDNQNRDYREPPDSQELREQIRITRALVKEVSREARENEAMLLLVTIPERGEVNPDRPARYLPEDGRPYWTAQREMLRELAENTSNVELLRMRPVLRSRIEDGTQVYYRGWDMHLNAKGYRLVAQQVYARLQNTGYISPDMGANLSRDFERDGSECPDNAA